MGCLSIRRHTIPQSDAHHNTPHGAGHQTSNEFWSVVGHQALLTVATHRPSRSFYQTFPLPTSMSIFSSSILLPVQWQGSNIRPYWHLPHCPSQRCYKAFLWPIPVSIGLLLFHPLHLRLIPSVSLFIFLCLVLLSDGKIPTWWFTDAQCTKSITASTSRRKEAEISSSKEENKEMSAWEWNLMVSKI